MSGSPHPISAHLWASRYVPALLKPKPEILPLVKCLWEQEDLDTDLQCLCLALVLLAGMTNV